MGTFQKNHWMWIAVLCAGVAVAGCEDDEVESAVETAAAPNEGAEAAEAEAPAEPAGPQPAGDGLVPGLDYPAVAAELTEGQRVFAPRAETWAGRVDSPEAELDFYPATVVTAGHLVSEVRHENHDETATVPNSLIIPIPSDPTTEVGSLVVGQAISDPRIAYVTEVGDEQIVTTIWNGNSHTEKSMPTGTWFAPEAPGAPGTYLHCAIDGLDRRYLSIHQQGDRRLVASFSGEVHSVPSEVCTPLPLTGLPAVGDTVRVLMPGSVKEASVEAVDEAAGQIVVEYEALGRSEQRRFQMGEIEFPVAPEPDES